MASEIKRPLPKPTEVTQPFWDGCKRHELLVQRCTKCGTFRYQYRPMCSNCNSMDYEWSKVSGKGEIFSFIIVPSPNAKAAPMGVFPPENYPLNVIIVELADAGKVHMISTLVDCKPEDIKIGMPVEVVFEDINEQVTLPKFKPA